MGGKRKKSENEGAGEDDSSNKSASKKMKTKKSEILPSSIKNKEKRSAVHSKLKHQKKVEKRKKLKVRDAAEKRAVELGEEPLPRQIPRTIENTREADETVCMPDDEELFAGNDVDEFSSIIKRDRTPKILITTSRFNSTRGPAFISELLSVIPNAQYYKRGTYDLKKIVEYANNKDFTSIIVVHTNRREPDALLFVCLPDGPTAHFKLSSLVLRKDIKNHGNPTSHEPELVLNNFTTRLGHRIGRLFQSIFPQEPNFRGRRVVTFHNQRDFIFFRHHRYIFDAKEIKQSEAKGKKAKDAKGESIAKEKVVARLQECGPRFTLKLISLQHGTFDTKGGEYEWVHKAHYSHYSSSSPFLNVSLKWTPAEEDFSCNLIHGFICFTPGMQRFSAEEGQYWQ
ncbi:Anticodon-binding protein [Corchorus capsularis]|uniref:Anticodon-binding protein n=1 Tax=Corchorus capsularis TaxID=210143 RepID=A0A1R3H1F0_COCAP|nr:Anticodon-binding protein [Corchorus capsularis]